MKLSYLTAPSYTDRESYNQSSTIEKRKRFSKGIANSKNLGSGQLPGFLEINGCTSSPVKYRESRKKEIEQHLFQTSPNFPKFNIAEPKYAQEIAPTFKTKSYSI